MYRWSTIYGITSITLFILKINKEKISMPSKEWSSDIGTPIKLTGYLIISYELIYRIFLFIILLMTENSALKLLLEKQITNEQYKIIDDYKKMAYNL